MVNVESAINSSTFYHPFYLVVYYYTVLYFCFYYNMYYVTYNYIKLHKKKKIARLRVHLFVKCYKLQCKFVY